MLFGQRLSASEEQLALERHRSACELRFIAQQMNAADERVDGLGKQWLATYLTKVKKHRGARGAQHLLEAMFKTDTFKIKEWLAWLEVLN